jgi:hypothetical protein
MAEKIYGQVPIFWLDLDDEFREYLGLETPTKQLPALVWNFGAEPGHAEGQVQLGELEIGLGCLLVLQEALDGEVDPEYSTDADALLRVLERHQEIFELETPEQVVLSLADFAGDKVDAGLRLAMLINGQVIAPDSEIIRSEIKKAEALMARGNGH